MTNNNPIPLHSRNNHFQFVNIFSGMSFHISYNAFTTISQFMILDIISNILHMIKKELPLLHGPPHPQPASFQYNRVNEEFCSSTKTNSKTLAHAN